MLTEYDVVKILREQQGNEAQGVFAARIGCDPGYFSKVMRQKAPPNGAILAHLRLMQIRYYLPVVPMSERGEGRKV